MSDIFDAHIWHDVSSLSLCLFINLFVMVVLWLSLGS